MDKDKNPIMREFKSGAKRDTDEGKVNYIRALSVLVLKSYGQYMLKHNSQRNGEKRMEDNWKKGFSLQSYMESKARHIIEGTWDIFAAAINEDDEFPEDEALENELLDALNAELFNTMGAMHTILHRRLLRQRDGKVVKN